LSENQNTPNDTTPIQNGPSRSFKIIYFGVTEKPLMGYNIIIITVALDVKVWK